MNIPEAINVMENEVRVAEVNGRPLEVKAFKLGIEALQRFIAWRRINTYLGIDTYYLGFDILPSETEE